MEHGGGKSVYALTRRVVSVYTRTMSLSMFVYSSSVEGIHEISQNLLEQAQVLSRNEVCPNGFRSSTLSNRLRMFEIVPVTFKY